MSTDFADVAIVIFVVGVMFGGSIGVLCVILNRAGKMRAKHESTVKDDSLLCRCKQARYLFASLIIGTWALLLFAYIFLLPLIVMSMGG